MTKPQNARRGRGRGPKRGGKQPGNAGRNDFRAKGNPKQLLDKYKSLARDAMQSGDRVLAENYFQHADHYQRVMNERSGIPTGVYEDPEQSFGDIGETDEAEDVPRQRKRTRSRAEDNASTGEGAPRIDNTDPRRAARDGADETPGRADADGNRAGDVDGNKDREGEGHKTGDAEPPRRRRGRPRRAGADTTGDTATDTAAE